MSFARGILIVLLGSYATLSTTSIAEEVIKAPNSVVATAFVVAPGYLITAYHAVRGQHKLYVARERDTTFTVAEVIGYSEDLDIALIRSAAKGRALQIGHWETFRKGGETFVIGFPKIGRLVSEKRITVGVYNGEQRFGARQDWFQLSAEIHKGNSGSPVIGADGKVYGVISHKLDAQQIAEQYGDLPQNVNFALKSSRLLEFLRLYDVEFSSGAFNDGAFYRPHEVFTQSTDSIFLLLSTKSN